MMKNVYSVGQVNTYIKNMFAQDFMMSRIRIRGEVSNCKYHTSGHIYFTMKDETGTISAVMFAGNRRGLTFRMKEGDRIVATGSVEVYGRDGRYQLYARQIEADGTGNLYLRYEALRKELEEMGMFSEEYKKPVPRVAKRVGIVTAPAGAAIQDIINIASRRNPYVQLILYPALVQGEGAVPSVINGIRALDALGVDVMIVGRGGGSIEDLWTFNEEEVARAIFECSTPVISAVGHETDFTIADFVADLRAPTPSAAAELAVYEYHILEEQMREYRFRMTRAVSRKVDHARLRLDHCRTGLRYLSPGSRLRERRKYAADLEEKLEQRMQDVLTGKRHQLALLSGALDGMSPVKKLSQGYAFVADESGQAVRDASQVTRGQTLDIHLLRGCLRAAVTGISLEEPAQREGEAWM